MKYKITFECDAVIGDEMCVEVIGGSAFFSIKESGSWTDTICICRDEIIALRDYLDKGIKDSEPENNH